MWLLGTLLFHLLSLLLLEGHFAETFSIIICPTKFKSYRCTVSPSTLGTEQCFIGQKKRGLFISFLFPLHQEEAISPLGGDIVPAESACLRAHGQKQRTWIQRSRSRKSQQVLEDRFLLPDHFNPEPSTELLAASQPSKAPSSPLSPPCPPTVS